VLGEWSAGTQQLPPAVAAIFGESE
jgi:hypothetical protein